MICFGGNTVRVGDAVVVCTSKNGNTGSKRLYDAVIKEFSPFTGRKATVYIPETGVTTSLTWKSIIKAQQD